MSSNVSNTYNINTSDYKAITDVPYKGNRDTVVSDRIYTPLSSSSSYSSTSASLSQSSACSSSSRAVVTGSQVFDRLPNAIDVLIFSFLKGRNGSIAPSNQQDDRQIMATASICKNWQNNPDLRREREAAAARLHHRVVQQEIQIINKYPAEIIRLFRNSGTSIFQLPVLDLGNRMVSRDICIYPEDMNRPIMRFQDRGGPGIVLKIQVSPKIMWRIHLSELSSRTRACIRNCDLDGMYYLSRRAWCFLRNWNQSREIALAIYKHDLDWSHAYSDRWNKNLRGHTGDLMACPYCPFAGNHAIPTVISSILNRQTPDFSLPGHNEVQRDTQATKGYRGLFTKAALVTALAGMAIACLASSYFTQE